MLLTVTRQARQAWHRSWQTSHNVHWVPFAAQDKTCPRLPAAQARCPLSTVSAALQDLVQTGHLRADRTQDFAAQVLSAVQSRIQQETQQRADQAPESDVVSKPDSAPEDACESDLSTENGRPGDNAPQQHTWPMPRGAYLWGTIGSGKTMLLDMFCTSFCELDLTDLGLCRLHFHEFMLSVHKSLHSLQQSVPRIRGKSQFGLPVYRYMSVVSQSTVQFF